MNICYKHSALLRRGELREQTCRKKRLSNTEIGVRNVAGNVGNPLVL